MSLWSRLRASGEGVRRSRRRLALLMFVVTAGTLTGTVLVGYATDVFRRPELDTVDARFRVRGERPAPKDVVVVAIDDKTFGDLKERWPFPRTRHAQAIDRLHAAGARTIAYDVQFTEPSRNPDEDNALIDAVGRARNVVLATTEANRGRTSVFGGDDVVREVHARVGHALVPTDPGGTLRRMPHRIDGVDSFGVAVAERATGRQIGGSGTEWIDYAGPPRTFRTLSFSDLLRGRVPSSQLRNKVAVVGPTAPTIQDIHPTSFSSDDLMSGPEIQANAVETALRGFPISAAPGVVNVLLILVLGLVGPLAAIRLSTAWAAFAGAVIGVVFAIVVQVLFNSGLIVALVAPLVSLVLGVVGAMAVGLVVAAYERERIRDLFSRFVPEQVVGEVLAHADQDLRLGGEQRMVTVLFSDIRGFTTFSESRPPDEVIEILNRYLTMMSDVIAKHGGTLVSYMGDGIMAMFGAPLEQPDHADRALAVAREMRGPVLDDFNAWVKDKGIADGFRIGVGLNTGEVMAGNVGSERRLEYTAIGDTTNTAARLEGMTKGTGYMVYVSDSTKEALGNDSVKLEPAGDLEVRGRQARLTVWGLPDVEATSTTYPER